MGEALTLIKLGSRIKELRIRKNLRQNDLAERCDFEKASMSRIESGRSNVTMRSLYKISKALEVDLAELFEDKTQS